jgi:hypothetical protein
MRPSTETPRRGPPAPLPRRGRSSAAAAWLPRARACSPWTAHRHAQRLSGLACSHASTVSGLGMLPARKTTRSPPPAAAAFFAANAGDIGPRTKRRGASLSSSGSVVAPAQTRASAIQRRVVPSGSPEHIAVSWFWGWCAGEGNTVAASIGGHTGCRGDVAAAEVVPARQQCGKHETPSQPQEQPLPVAHEPPPGRAGPAAGPGAPHAPRRWPAPSPRRARR